jgi:hypothetical protein
MYQKDLLAFGQWGDKRAKPLGISEIKWQKHSLFPLHKLKNRYFTLYYDDGLISSPEAIKFINLLEIMRDGYCKQYGIFLPETIFVYLYRDSITVKEFNCYSNSFNTIWLKFSDRQSFLMPQKGSPIYTIAHELARISFQPLSDEYPPAIGADDWSHYAPLVGIVPYVYKCLSDTAWFSKYSYQDYGISLFEKIYQGAENTYAWLLYEIDKKYGKEMIGKAIKMVIKNKYWRHPKMKDFMVVLGKLTKDKKIINQIKNAYPTPFEHSLSRWKRWKGFGFKPYLEEMFIFENRYVIDSIIPNSYADSVGIEQGDELVMINGFDLGSKKADAYKSLLHKNPGDKITFIIRKKKSNELKQVIVLIK